MTALSAAPPLASALAALTAADTRDARVHAIATLREALVRGPVAPVVRTLPLASLPVPTRVLAGPALDTHAPFVRVTHRALLVQCLDRGAVRTLLWNPTDVSHALHVPALAHLRKGLGRVARALTFERHAPVDAQLAEGGISPEAVDFVAFDALDVQYPAGVLARFPRAKLVVTATEWSRYTSAADPVDRALRVPGPEVDRERVEVIDAPRMMGDGVVLAPLGGRRPGALSLAVRSARGVLVASGSAWGLDAYSPRTSRLPGLAHYARTHDARFVPAFPALGGTALDAMALEHALADRLPSAPLYPFVLPSLEIVPSALAPLVRPGAQSGEITLGTLVRK